MNRAKLFGWWYLSIGGGFTLLAIQRYMVGGLVSLIVLRLVIAAGFFWLGWAELSGKIRR